MRLFALEYFRQMINSDIVHFFYAKKKAQLRIKSQLGPFVCNSRDAGKEVERILEDYLKLQISFYWVPYDPNSFICDRRMKNKLSPYIHQRIPEIEQYANMDEWMEGTLIEQDSEQVSVENVMKYLEKILDLDSFGQVQIPGIGSSSFGTSQQNLQEISALATVASKGKEKEADIQVTEKFTMTEQPETSKEKGKIQVSPTQTNVAEISIIKTPLNVEKS